MVEFEKRVRQYAQQVQEGTQDRRHVLKEFSKMLDHQVEKNCAIFPRTARTSC